MPDTTAALCRAHRSLNQPHTRERAMLRPAAVSSWQRIAGALVEHRFNISITAGHIPSWRPRRTASTHSSSGRAPMGEARTPSRIGYRPREVGQRRVVRYVPIHRPGHVDGNRPGPGPWLIVCFGIGGCVYLGLDMFHCAVCRGLLSVIHSFVRSVGRSSYTSYRRFALHASPWALTASSSACTATTMVGCSRQTPELSMLLAQFQP